MPVQFSTESPKWQQDWFRLHWVPFWNSLDLDKRAVVPAKPKRAEFCNYLRTLNFNAYLDSNGIICVELTTEEYMLAFCQCA